MKKLRPAAISVVFALLCTTAFSASAAAPQRGKLLYHHYSSYSAMDSELLLHDFTTGETLAIADDAFLHAMNADFGSHCGDIVFMAIDPIGDEWDIFRYNLVSGDFTNLTQASGFRNEDPKFSTDGKKIVFKRGRWDAQTDGFVYDLAEMELQTGEITMLTDSAAEESMPYYAPDGGSIYFSRIENGETAICVLDRNTGSITRVYAENGVHTYYPVLSDAGLYFTKWHSAALHNDCIVKMEDTPVLLPVNAQAYNCSDPFPLHDGSLFFSSTREGGYDLYFYDGETEHTLTALSTPQEDLGTAFYELSDAEAIIAETTDFLLCRESGGRNMDADGNGVVNAFDLAILKRMAK